MTTDGNGRFVYLDPKIGGKRAVAEACANIVSSGALPLGMTDCLNYGDPNVPEIYWELHRLFQATSAFIMKITVKPFTERQWSEWSD